MHPGGSACLHRSTRLISLQRHARLVCCTASISSFAQHMAMQQTKLQQCVQTPGFFRVNTISFFLSGLIPSACIGAHVYRCAAVLARCVCTNQTQGCCCACVFRARRSVGRRAHSRPACACVDEPPRHLSPSTPVAKASPQPPRHFADVPPRCRPMPWTRPKDARPLPPACLLPACLPRSTSPSKPGCLLHACAACAAGTIWVCTRPPPRRTSMQRCSTSSR